MRLGSRHIALVVLVGCANPAASSREQRIISALSDDNWVAAVRDPELVRQKLRKMQRGPYEWFRGTAALFWRDLMEPGVRRATTTFGDAASSRVLLVGDPHVENAGTFRAADGTMLVDWNDFDATGYGPFTGDLRRLGASLAIAAPSLADPLVRRALTAYAQTMATIAAGGRLAPISTGRSADLDEELAEARTRGEMRFALDELAPAGADGVRRLALGDLEEIAEDGVIEDRVVTVTEAEAVLIDRAIARWGHPELGATKLRARRIGAGVSSYAALRWNVVLEGATASPDDDRVIELKEVREGVVITGRPRVAAAEWDSPAARAVTTQQRLQARADIDPLLGSALVGGLALRIRDREAFQRGLDHEALAKLATGTEGKQARALELAAIYGEMLARAHGLARTEAGMFSATTIVRGVDAIAPLLAGREVAFVDELARLALADAAQIASDFALVKDRDLFAELAP